MTLIKIPTLTTHWNAYLEVKLISATLKLIFFLFLAALWKSFLYYWLFILYILGVWIAPVLIRMHFYCMCRSFQCQIFYCVPAFLINFRKSQVDYLADSYIFTSSQMHGLKISSPSSHATKSTCITRLYSIYVLAFTYPVFFLSSTKPLHLLCLFFLN